MLLKLWTFLRGKKLNMSAVLMLIPVLGNLWLPQWGEVWDKIQSTGQALAVLGLVDKAVQAVPDRYVPIKALRTGDGTATEPEATERGDGLRPTDHP
jgi:hypothetical protein